MKASQRARNRGPKQTYFIVAALVIYSKQEDVGTHTKSVQKQRHMNAILTADGDNLNQDSLLDVNRAFAARLQAENGIDPSAIQDVVVLGVSRLGHMTEAEFLGQHGQPLEGAQPMGSA